MWLPNEDKYNQRKNELLDGLVVAMGGRVAEEVVFGDVTSGAVGDIRMATNTARRMVCEWGMSEKVGMVGYGDDSEPIFLGRDMAQTRAYSEETAKLIDSEVKHLVDTGYNTAKELISKNREALDAIAKALLEYESLDGTQIRELMETGSMSNPPKIGGGEGDQTEETDEARDQEEDEEKGRTPPLDADGLAGAPA
jgi:cell division protease FtsH